MLVGCGQNVGMQDFSDCMPMHAGLRVMQISWLSRILDRLTAVPRMSSLEDELERRKGNGCIHGRAKLIENAWLSYSWVFRDVPLRVWSPSELRTIVRRARRARPRCREENGSLLRICAPVVVDVGRLLGAGVHPTTTYTDQQMINKFCKKMDCEWHSYGAQLSC